MAALQTSGLYHRVDLFVTYPYCIYPKTVEISHGRKRVAHRLTVVSTNLEYRESEKQGKRESRRQASEAQREKERQRARARARDKKQRIHFLLEEKHENFVAVVRK